jgi:hypothetical protein
VADWQVQVCPACGWTWSAHDLRGAATVATIDTEVVDVPGGGFLWRDVPGGDRAVAVRLVLTCRRPRP